MATLTPAMAPVNRVSSASPHAHAGLLRPSRSQRSRAYDVEAAGLGALVPGATLHGSRNAPAPFDLWVTLYKGGKSTRYAVAVNGWTQADGLLSTWYKCQPSGWFTGTHYNLAFTGFAGSCDCTACCYEAVMRADRRHGSPSGSYGCQKLDTFAALVVAGTVPDPRANGEADHG